MLAGRGCLGLEALVFPLAQGHISDFLHVAAAPMPA